MNMRRLFKVTLTTLVACLVSIPLLSCAAQPESTPVSESQVVTVQRGDLIIDIAAVGNLALSHTEDLAIDIFYPEATVEEVLVEEGDTVEEGQVLAKLDIEEWEDELSALEDKVTAAERQMTSAERQLTVKEIDLLQAEINLKNAEIALEQTETTYSLSDFKVAQAEVDEAERNLEETLLKLSKYEPGSPGYKAYQEILLQAQARLDTSEAKLEAMSSGFDTVEVTIKKLQVEVAQGRLEDAQKAIEDAQTAIEDAGEALVDAQEELDDAKSKSPVITALFDGFITRVNVEGGDEVLKGTVAVQLADPTKFEAEVMVSEMDILQVKVGGEAWVQVDAMPGLSLPAKVTHISPTATIQSGVVNYKVRVEVQSLEEMMQQRQAAGQEAMQKIEQGELPERLQQAIESGRITQEQAEEMMKQRQQEGGLSGEQSGEWQGPMPTMIPEDFQLREGLTVTVSILVDQRTDVLLVPNKAITSQGGKIYVQVVSADGVTEERSIKIGISDWQFTEVIDGLSEGEQVVVPGAGTATTPTTPQQGGRMPFLPGGGRPH